MMTIVSMRMKSNKSPEELDRLSRAGFPKFRALDSLSQKYYIHHKESNTYGGLYLFHTREAAEAYVKGPIVASVAERFGVVGEVSVEILDVMYTLDSE